MGRSSSFEYGRAQMLTDHPRFFVSALKNQIGKNMALLVQESKYWPLALAVAQGEPTLEMHRHSRNDWDKWLSTKHRFHILRFFNDESSLITSKKVGKETKQWIKDGAGEEIKTWAKSMMIVVPKDQHTSLQKMSITKAFGIPGGIFPSVEDAFNWLKAQPEGEDMFTINTPWVRGIQNTIQTILEKDDKEAK